MSIHSELTERGIGIFGELMGEDRAISLRGHIRDGGYGSSMAKLAADFAFASVWGRAELDRKQRSLVVLSVLIALRQPDELKNHVRVALRNGLSPKQIEEVLLQVAPYVGFPMSGSASNVVEQVFREEGLLPGHTTNIYKEA